MNTLYVTSEDAALALDGDNIVIKRSGEVAGRFPLHLFDTIISFSYFGATPALMGKCAETGIGLSFCKPNGRFLATVNGEANGNVLLRREQYRIADDGMRSVLISRMMIFGKLYNARWVLERTIRDHSLRVDSDKINETIDELKNAMAEVRDTIEAESLRGIEGKCAQAYFSVFNEMILRDKDAFAYKGRTRRPPQDRCNALLSFVYMLLTSMCRSALDAVGLDSYVGFLHTDRPGRASLALDLVEELRPCMGDRFVLTLINNRVVSPNDFVFTDTGAVEIKDNARKAILTAWQNKKKEEIVHPFLKEKLPWGLVPYVQAQMLARYIRGDLDGYPPFLWK